jgi:glucose/arabinose dehydrogenase
VTRVVAIAVLGGLALAACADDSGPAQQSDGVGTVVAPSPDLSAAPPAVTPNTAPGSDGTTFSPATPDPAVGDPIVSSELVVEVDNPVDLAVRPGDDALYLVGQRGTITRFDPANGAAATVFDITGQVSSSNEQGLLGLAFSPDATRAYVDFTDTAGDTTITEYTVGDDGAFVPESERVVLTVDQPYRNHNAGDLAFGPDGMLYITLGDGGSGGDPQRRASDPTDLLGSLLRIDPTPDGDRPYTIPSDNPFVSGPVGATDGAPEVWAWGLRNPWKIAFDPVTAELWIADVGQNAHEEVDVVGPVGDRDAGWGRNFGWSAFEGTVRFNEDVPDPGDTVVPVLTYPHSSGGCSISGGAPYRGSAIAELEPAYVYSDYCLGTLWALDLDGRRNLVLLEGFSEVTAVRPGPDGELYVLERSGGVHRLTPG